jgi:hypothetical protein
VAVAEPPVSPLAHAALVTVPVQPQMNTLLASAQEQVFCFFKHSCSLCRPVFLNFYASLSADQMQEYMSNVQLLTAEELANAQAGVQVPSTLASVIFACGEISVLRLIWAKSWTRLILTGIARLRGPTRGPTRGPMCMCGRAFAH